MAGRWYRNAVIYSVDVRLFQDSDGDGIGDLPGLIDRMDYLSRLGVNTLWLNPIHPSPFRDGGYDVTDHFAVDPSLGDLGDMALLLSEAAERGVRVMLDLVVNHTSDEHPWFKAACAGSRSPRRDFYVWSDTEPADRWEGQVFPGAERETWTFHEGAGAWYRHRFYRSEPDLNTDHPEVQKQIFKIAEFWLRLGVSGFRIDAAPFLVDRVAGGGPDYTFLREMRDAVSWRAGDAVLLAEANVENDELLEYVGQADGTASRATMLFAFRLNQAMMLALARCDARPIRDVLAALPDLPKHAQWATFLRNHDEVDLGRLTPAERRDVFAAFGPEPEMQLYDRGIRRRLAPMLNNDRRRIELAYSLQFTMPGTPVIRYGDEIGMGEDLRLPQREAIRTPMQWTDTANAGFSTANPSALVAPVIDEGPYGFRTVNVTAQRRDEKSLLVWFERMLHTLRECPEVGRGHHEVLDAGLDGVLAHRATLPEGRMLFLHNLTAEPCEVRLRPDAVDGAQAVDIAADGPYDGPVDVRGIGLSGYGYRWIRLRS
ncbi:alpha-amylase family protein [Dactylosporangium sp. CS-047395]|uniref:alpha-amylase family protein n=1 Tax=Dactylosporangium sp. CS-047395 TaxID=3239936 RepID=UPI003D8AB454